MLDERVYDQRLPVMQMSSDADIPGTVGVLKRIQQILSLIVRLQVLLIIIALIRLCGHQWSLQGLSILLLYLDLSPGIHLLVALVKLFILVQDDPVLIGNWQHLLDASW